MLIKMSEKENSAKRLVSHKIRIKDLIEGEFIKLEGWEPSYILTKTNKRISRINIIATIIEVNDQSKLWYIDDGTSSISIRFLGDIIMPIDIKIGEIIMVIGRVRKYGEEVYIAPEIVKKIDDPKWVKVRQLEILKQELELDDSLDENDLNETDNKNENIEDKSKILNDNKTKSISEQKEEKKNFENKKEESLEETLMPSQKICKMIKQLDLGKGANIDELKEKLNMLNIDKLLQTLLEEGEIFEIRPGKLKVLE